MFHIERSLDTINWLLEELAKDAAEAALQAAEADDAHAAEEAQSAQDAWDAQLAQLLDAVVADSEAATISDALSTVAAERSAAREAAEEEDRRAEERRYEDEMAAGRRMLQYSLRISFDGGEPRLASPQNSKPHY